MLSDVLKFVGIIHQNQDHAPEKTQELIAEKIREWINRGDYVTIDAVLSTLQQRVHLFDTRVITKLLRETFQTRGLYNSREDFILSYCDSCKQRIDSETLLKEVSEIEMEQPKVVKQEIIDKIDNATDKLRLEVPALKETADKLVNRRTLEAHIAFHKNEINHHTHAVNELERQLEKL